MMPSKGSTLNAAVCDVMSQSGAFLTEMPPIATVSVPLRRWSSYSVLLVTGSVFTPVAKLRTFVRPPSTNVLLAAVLKRCWVLQFAVQAVLGNSKVSEPVSKT
jgi:hypothetical protein